MLSTDEQAKFAKSWFDAATAGFAMAGSVGAITAGNLWPPAGTRMPSAAMPWAIPAGAWPLAQFAAAANPLSTLWWRMALSIHTEGRQDARRGDPCSTSEHGSRAEGECSEDQQPASDAEPAPQRAPSYRTATGHAMAAILNPPPASDIDNPR